jgi:hypothetical protein
LNGLRDGRGRRGLYIAMGEAFLGRPLFAEEPYIHGDLYLSLSLNTQQTEA